MNEVMVLSKTPAMQETESHKGYAINAAAGTIIPVNEYPRVTSRRTPKVGEMVAIKHQVKYSNSGEVLGLQRSDTVQLEEITATYLDGTIRTGSSDVWKVKACEGSKVTKGAAWETVNPARPDYRQEK